jgi:hypothetical protein
MHSVARGLAPLRILLRRALVAYPLLRALLAVVGALLDSVAGGGASQQLESPLGVVLIAAAVGLADTRRRGERFLWANLGYSPTVAPAVFALVALVGELLLAWIGP